MTIKAGVISDTHRNQPDADFCRAIEHCFSECDVIIHAGDITDLAVLQAFGDKEQFAVRGNMCNYEAQQQLPLTRTFALGNFTIGLTHGAQLGFDIETRLWDLFPEVDCMIYGHTHEATCHTVAGVLVVNPGSFRPTGRFGAPGTYAILEAGDELSCSLHSIPQL